MGEGRVRVYRDPQHYRPSGNLIGDSDKDLRSTYCLWRVEGGTPSEIIITSAIKMYRLCELTVRTTSI